MLRRFKLLSEWYYNFWLRLANLKEKVTLFPIDFNQHWFSVVAKQKIYLFITMSCVATIQVFYAIYPMFFENPLRVNLKHFVYLLSVWLFIIFLEFFSVYCGALMEVQCINSVLYNAFKHFLTVDPLYHTMKSTGKLFAKVERCARAYEDFIDVVLWDIMPIIVSLTSVVTVFLIKDFTLGITACILLLLTAILNIFLNLFTIEAFEKKIIDADDDLKSLSVESLTQVQLIRSSFATNEIDNLTRQRASNLMYKGGTSWIAFASSVTISRLAYLGTIFVLGYIVFSLIDKGTITLLSGIAILVTYLNGTYEVIEIGRRLRKLLKATLRISDMYSFIQTFGKQTYPVLEPVADVPIIPVPEDRISIAAHDIYFLYNPRVKIFDGHNLVLEVPKDQPRKLYGIIGPSGIGKTTLLSLLGGQLRPDKGIVLMNGVPIYQVDDAQRRSLIALQGQVASSLSGTVRRNLLLGLPQDNHFYSDPEIIEVLKKVGIWPVFEEKQGLDTAIGESGLNLSGGQRQRLNFASLYLRAKHYKPAVILIDEPTSSLDQLSEQSITTMISELSHRALTIVIAHRLKTLDDAYGIFDFSLIEENKNITFYPRDILEQKSTYYKKLLQGDIAIED